MSRYEKKMKDKLDDEINLAALDSLVPEETDRSGLVSFRLNDDVVHVIFLKRNCVTVIL